MPCFAFSFSIPSVKDASSSTPTAAKEKDGLSGEARECAWFRKVSGLAAFV
jgi:hypothetical protein